MIYSSTILSVSDNSGVVYAKCLNVSKRLSGKIGSLVKVSIKLGKFKTKLKTTQGVIVSTRKSLCRKTGFYISFSSNVVVLLNEKNEPLGTRIFGPLPLELRKKNWLKLLSLGSIFI